MSCCFSEISYIFGMIGLKKFLIKNKMTNRINKVYEKSVLSINQKILFMSLLVFIFGLGILILNGQRYVAEVN